MQADYSSESSNSSCGAAKQQRMEVLYFQKSMYLSFSRVAIQLSSFFFFFYLNFVHVEADILNLAGFLGLQQSWQTCHKYFC